MARTVSYTTAGKVNAALKRAGIEIEVVKGEGYFWFDNRYPKDSPFYPVEVESLFEWPRLIGPPSAVVAHVREAMAEREEVLKEPRS